LIFWNIKYNMVKGKKHIAKIQYTMKLYYNVRGSVQYVTNEQ
jgi:hypothetical protein